MDNPAYISNYKAVTNFYGFWPSFHDANVIEYKISLEAIDLTLHTWQMTREVDSKGHFILKKHSLVKFRFKGISDAKMDAFSANNILYELNLVPEKDLSSFTVELESVMDMSGSFSSRAGEVSITPCESDGSAAAK
jgi:hypothetical protein